MARQAPTVQERATVTPVDTELDPRPLHVLERHRADLTAHCRRILGSASEADDAVQETLVRAWRGFAGFEGRASLRSWLLRIATNVCLDMRRAPQRRARPMDPASWTGTDVSPGGRHAVVNGRQTVPIGHAEPGADPAEQAVVRDAVHQAFAAALRHLPPRQRAVLILRDVLRWRAAEVAELLGTTETAVNSTLQRAHSRLATAGRPAAGIGSMDRAQRLLVRRQVDALQRHDVGSLVALMQ